MTRAKIITGKANTKLFDLLKQGCCLLRKLHDYRFSDLNFERATVNCLAANCGSDVTNDIGFDELAG